MSAIVRSLEIRYGSLTFKDMASGYAIEGPVSPSFTYRGVSFSFSIIVVGSSVADFESKCEALIEGIRIPRQDITVTFGTRVHEYKQSENTGWEQEGSITPADGSVFNTNVSREYNVRLSAVVGATLAGDAGVEDYNYSYSIGADGILKLDIAGTITTDGASLKAEQNYEDKIDAIVAQVQSDISSGSASWTESVELRGIERFNYEMTFTRSYTERIFKDSLGQDDIDSIKFPVITISPTLVYDANAVKGVKRPVQVVATYNAVIDKRQSQNLIFVWNEYVIPLLRGLAEEYAQELYDNAEIQFNAFEPTFNPTGNTVSGRVLFTVYGSQELLAASIEEDIFARSGAIKVGVYGTGPYQRARLPGQAVAKASLTLTVTVRGDKGVALTNARSFPLVPTLPGPPGARLSFRTYRLLTRNECGKLGGSGGGWSLDDESIKFVGPLYAGDPDIPITTCIITRTFDYDEDAPVRIPSSGGLVTVVRR